MHKKLLIVLACGLNLLIAWLYLSPVRNRPLWDFPQFYFAGKLMLQGKAPMLYATEAYIPLLDELQRFDKRMTGQSVYFNRPPFEALILWPLAFFSFGTAMKLAFFANLAILALLVWKLPIWLGASPGIRLWIFIFMPFLYSCAFGQDTLLLTLLVAFAFRQITRGRDVLAGALLALGAFKPHLLWAVPIALIAARKWRCLCASAITATVLFVISFVMVGEDGLRDWFDLLRAPSTDFRPWAMANLRALTLHLGPVAGWGAGIGTLVFFGLALKGKKIERALPAAIATGVLLSPHAYLQDHSLLAIAAITAGPLPGWLALLPWPYFYPYDNYVPFVLLGILSLAGLAGTFRRPRKSDLMAVICLPIRQSSQDRSERDCSASSKSV